MHSPAVQQTFKSLIDALYDARLLYITNSKISFKSSELHDLNPARFHYTAWSTCTCWHEPTAC